MAKKANKSGKALRKGTKLAAKKLQRAHFQRAKGVPIDKAGVVWGN